MPDYFGAGFAEGFGKSLGAALQAGQEAKTRREELKLKKLILDAELKKSETQNKLYDLKLQEAQRDPAAFLEKQLGALQKFGINLGGGGGGGTQSGAGSGPLRGAMGGGGEPGMTEQASAQEVSPAEAPTGGMELQGLTLDSKTGALKFDIGNRQYESHYEDYQAAPGLYKRRVILSDKSRPGAMIIRDIPGAPVPPAAIQEAYETAKGLGAPEGAGAEHIASMVLAAKALPAEQQPAALEQLQKEARYLASQAGGKGTLDVGEVIETTRTEKAKTAGAEAKARFENSPLGESEKTAIGSLEGTLTAIADLKREFPDTAERAKFVGLFNEPAKKMSQLGKADPRFAKFQAIMGRVKLYAFGEGGKNLTAQEKAVIDQFVPQGNELSSTDFEEKLAYAEEILKKLMSSRKKLATQTVGDLAGGKGVKFDFDDPQLERDFQKLKKKFPKMTPEELASHYEAHGAD